MVDHILKGYNATALAYGITGSGKTHSMFGDLYNENNQEQGIIYYSINSLFERIKTLESTKMLNIKVSRT